MAKEATLPDSGVSKVVELENSSQVLSGARWKHDRKRRAETVDRTYRVIKGSNTEGERRARGSWIESKTWKEMQVEAERCYQIKVISKRSLLAAQRHPRGHPPNWALVDLLKKLCSFGALKNLGSEHRRVEVTSISMH